MQAGIQYQVSNSLISNANICTAKIVAFFRISAVLKVEYPLHISPPKQKLTMLPSEVDVKELHREMTHLPKKG
jgi:hypothetical protein